MKFSSGASLGVTALAGLAQAASIGTTLAELAIRALPNAPDGYAPAEVDCPSTKPSIRSASTISPSEQKWLEARRNKTADAMVDFFNRNTIDNFNAADYIKNHSKNATALPNIGIAVSGGGYRALMNGAGAINAFDSRANHGDYSKNLGGLLQSATYLAGLSGGGWLVGSLYINNDSTVPELQYGDGTVWEFNRSILEGPTDGGIELFDSASYYKEVYNTVQEKKDAKFEISLTDIWGRALSYQLINAEQGGPSYTWSSIALDQKFKDGDVPMPILVADGRNPGEKLILGNATVFEFNPFEFGTFDPTIFGFAPLEYLGSAWESGELPRNESCVRGFDNAGFVMGTSSSLFNQFLVRLDTVDLPSFLKDLIEKLLASIDQDNNDIAEYKPNPFYGYSKNSSPFADVRSLPVVDGGEDGQNLPLHPLIQPERHVDVVFAVDSSADTEYNWPNGASLVATYSRSLNSSGIANSTAFPAVPDNNTFVNLGLNKKPTFFGCDSSNMTGPSPLIVYIPNAPYTTFSNVSTFTLAYNTTQRNAIIQNGYDVATQGNGTEDSNWSTCVGCAMLSRSLERTNTTVPAACKSCFDKYCWDGRLDTKTPDTYAPKTILEATDLTNGASDNSGKLSLIAAVAAAVFMLISW